MRRDIDWARRAIHWLIDMIRLAIKGRHNIDRGCESRRRSRGGCIQTCRAAVSWVSLDIRCHFNVCRMEVVELFRKCLDNR